MLNQSPRIMIGFSLYIIIMLTIVTVPTGMVLKVTSEYFCNYKITRDFDAVDTIANNG